MSDTILATLILCGTIMFLVVAWAITRAIVKAVTWTVITFAKGRDRFALVEKYAWGHKAQLDALRSEVRMLRMQVKHVAHETKIDITQVAGDLDGDFVAGNQTRGVENESRK